MINALFAANDATAKIVIFLIIGAIVFGIIAYYVARFLKGSIKLHLPNARYNAGDLILGSFDIHTKKHVQGNRLVVSLIGTKTTRTRHGNSTRSHTEEIYRDESVIEDARDYDAGTMEHHEFELSTPSAETPEFFNSGVGKALAVAARFLGAGSSRIRWKVEVRLDAKGVDLVASKTVKLNAGGLF